MIQEGRTIAIDPAKSAVTITMDFAAIDANNKDGNNGEILPQEVMNHELGHSQSVLEDPVKFSNDDKSGDPVLRKLQEMKADEIKKTIGADGVDQTRYPDPESLRRAENDTRVLFGLPKKTPEQKKAGDK